MKVIDRFPYPVREIETEWIPMPDGCRLAARLWLPEGAEHAPVPAVLDYIPYRRRDHNRRGDSRMMPYLAGHGYAGVRVDLRGSGDSEGVLEDEYLELEQDDGLAVIRWLAEQPWCDGSVAMIGISWGGFNGLQIAARRPPELKTVISLCSTDDRYADDVHYMGGCLLGDNLSWASVMFGFNSLPPDPAVVGERWREMWKQRLDGSGLWLAKWLRHQRRDDYWKQGSVCEDYAAIQVPVLLASGWADGYSNAIFRMLEHLRVPRQALIGPWSHIYPQYGTPGPAIGFLQEVIRWLDHWIKGRSNGVDEDPQLRVWMQHSVPPHPTYEHRPGRWVAERQWPSDYIRPCVFHLRRHALECDAQPERKEETLSIESPLSVGMFAGKWCSYAAPPDLPHDQREEDGGALIFETEPLEVALEMLGAAVAELALSANKPVAMVAARLSDVAPDGEATRVTYGLLNLTHRDSHEHPRALEPNKCYPIRLQLNDVAQRFEKGHRIRLSISTSYFPLAWPPPSGVCLTIHTHDSRLILPERPPRESDKTLREFGEPEAARGAPTTMLEPVDHRWTVIRDLANDVSTLEVVINDGLTRFEEHGMEAGSAITERYQYWRGEYASFRGEVVGTWRLQRRGWSIRTEARTVLTSDVQNFYIHATLDAYEDDQRFSAHDWNYTIPRDEV
ncbi:CocE/NonD family hydrolase [Thiohalobacter thiocyanaticus]|uniref:CocE/NonD family hydrolase n=1 Tax=Thiohalobacter thiocyanaticus TaxID=585455 RepID=A0A426QLU5_9GAMM|nr:CocE/NonD family hydrolase [Thiohalobacter thiocyanaticus]RRQ22744.1 CocE/NonD family hydrolase [Thiohalobacter thiocyanaticus]